MVRKAGIWAVCPSEPQPSPSPRGRWVLLTPVEAAALDRLVFLFLSLGTRCSSATQEAVRGLHTPPKVPMVEDLFTS